MTATDLPSATAAIDTPAAVEDLPIFADLPTDVLALVAASFEPRTYRFGDVIVHEGDDADAFYVLTAGRARVVKAGAGGAEVALTMLGRGDSFGETGLVERSTRTATVRASGDVEALRLDRTLFEGLLRTHPSLRDAVLGHRRRGQLRDLFRLYTAFAELPDDALNNLLLEVEEISVRAGEVLIEAGAPAGPAYVVEDGRLRTHRDGTDVGFHHRGDVVGERSLFTNTPRAATVEAVSDATLLVLAPDTFRDLLNRYPEFRARMAERIQQYDYQSVARVPLDFAQELLPADVRDAAANGPAPTAGTTIDGTRHSVPEPEAQPFNPDDVTPQRRRRRRMRVRQVWQIDEMDCGAACLAMVAGAHGRRISLTRARDLVGTELDGSSLAGLVRGAEALGLSARAVKVSRDNLAALPLPAIAHWDGYHWVVLTEVNARGVRITDPAYGNRRYSRDEFDDRWTGYAAVIEAPADGLAPDDQEPEAGLSWVWGLLRPHRARLVLAVVLALAASALQMAVPVFMQIVVDRVVPGSDVELLRILLLAMGGILAALVVAGFVHRYLLAWIAVRVDGGAMDVLSERLLALPMSYFHTRRTGDIQRRISGAQQVRHFAVQEGISALTAATQLMAALALMVRYSPLLATVYLAATPIYAGLMRYGSRRLRPIFDQLEEAYGRYHSRQIDAVKGIEAVKAMGAEAALQRELVEQFDGLTRKLFRADLGATMYRSSVQIIAFVSLVAFVWIGTLQVLDGNMTVGALVSFSTLVVFANAAIVNLLSLWDAGQRASVLVSRLRDVFEVEPEQGHDHDHLAPVPTMSGQVTLDRVGFRYGPNAQVLTDINLDIAPGTTVAIVGRSGSGKTTLAKCLLGLLEPTEGAIRYDGIDMASLDYRALRRHIGAVLQDNYLFAVTIAENIALGDPEPDAERVRWAAQAASAHDFIARLPLGYDTKVGETGLQLSGGQKQRIAIARAVYQQPALLILDEATSALDAESEQAVQEGLDRLLAQRTSFVIAHRLSTIRDADVIVVLEAGRIAEMGSHDELMARQGLYFYLSSRQLDL